MRPGGRRLTLLYIDMDGFKRVNDSHGHAMGDELLRLFAARIKASVRESEVVARLGGDDFVVILGHATQGPALEIADRLNDHLSRPYRIGSLAIEISASIGLAACPASGTHFETLLEAAEAAEGADAAMYLAKEGGRGRHLMSKYSGH